MDWLIPIALFALSVLFWRLSHSATDELVAWCRFLLAFFLLLLVLIYSVAIVAQMLVG